jgi:hypothetical protein
MITPETPKIRKHNPSTYYNYLDTSRSWSNVVEFSEWYLDNKMPIRILDKQEIFVTDISTSWIMFREGRFQVELYLMPEMVPDAPDHAHPYMDVATITISYVGNGDSNAWWGLPRVLKAGEVHGSMANGRGSSFLAIQHWNVNDEKMTSAAVNWRGKLCGPVHANLIREYYPNTQIGGDLYWNVTDAPR